VVSSTAPAHGGQLVDLLVGPDRASELREGAVTWPSWRLTTRQLCDLELLACGGFSPLQGFLGRADYESVCATMRLADGSLWPMPITLDVTESALVAAQSAGVLALRDSEGVMMAALQLTDAWRPDLRREAELVLGGTDPLHPGVDHLLNRTNPWYIAGLLEVVQLPEHWDFRDLRHTPAQLRAEFERLGWQRIVAFNTRNPMHRAHQELTLQAARQADANVLIHPIVGVTKPGDVDPFTRVRCYQAILPDYPQGSVMLSVLPLAMRMGGPREALWHAIIRKNFGATHFIVGRDHAGPGLDAAGRPFYGPYEAQELVARHETELGIGMVPFKQMVYVAADDAFVPEDEAPPGGISVSGTQLRRLLEEGREPPPWFTPPRVAAELRRTYPPRARRGLTIFFTGLSGAGKSTIAGALCAKLEERGDRRLTLLDGDLVRELLSSELGFSPEHRDLNILRIGFVAAEITRHGGVAVCAPIAPYDGARRQVRRMVEGCGGFVLVHVATPLDVCEERDRKGLYAKARRGLLPHFTGISDPYEEPTDAEIVLRTVKETPDEAAGLIVAFLERLGYLADVDSTPDCGPDVRQDLDDREALALPER
jgi:sulfate adenylyltransferase